MVLYSAAGRIAEAFVVSAGARVKIPEPNVSRVIVCLFAVYYVWHCKYPTAYLNMLQYFDVEIIRAISKNCKVIKFIRDMEHKNETTNETTAKKKN